MTFFASSYEWPTHSIEFTAVGDGARDGAGEIVEHNDRFVLRAPGCFSYATGHPVGRTLKTAIDGRPSLVRGSVFVLDGELGLLLDELRVGSDRVDAMYVEVAVEFEHLGSVCSYRLEDGAQRSPTVPLRLPTLEDEVPITATFPTHTDTVSMSATSAIALDDFESHLVAMQDLLTFAAGLPVGRRRLHAKEDSGAAVDIFGRERFAPFARATRRPIEHQLRLSADWAQTVIDRWWAGQVKLRPILQVLTGLRYQPGYVEADIIFSAVAIESLASRTDVGERPRLSAADAQPMLEALDSLTGLGPDQRQVVAAMKREATRTTLQSKVELLLDGVNDRAITNSRVSVDTWLPKFKKTRNDIAHGNGGEPQSREIWTNDSLLRAVRDANQVLLTLALLTHLGVPDAAIELAAERLGTRYSGRHRATGIFV